jgi:hypothetical protein
MRGVVRHSCHRQLRAVVIQHDMLIQQHPCAQSPQFVDPRVSAGIVLVVTRDDVGSVSRFEPPERLGMMREFQHAAVDDVASDRNHVGTQAIHSIDDRLHKFRYQAHYLPLARGQCVVVTPDRHHLCPPLSRHLIAIERRPNGIQKDVSRRKPLIGTRENDQEVGFSGSSPLICKAMETGAARNLRESHGTLRNKNKELATA